MFNDKVLQLYDLTFFFQYKLLNTDTCKGWNWKKKIISNWSFILVILAPLEERDSKSIESIFLFPLLTEFFKEVKYEEMFSIECFI